MEEVRSEGNINVPPGPPGPSEGISIPEYVAPVQASLLRIFKPGYIKIFGDASDADVIEYINRTLRVNNAIVAGGFLLDSINNHREANVDVDMYVPCRNLSRFNKIMAKLGECRGLLQHYATFYCRSFLRINGIRSVQAFYNVTTDRNGIPSRHVMDIMAVRNSRSPLDVVQNFDLTFCQIWYDGENVFATHPDHIRTKKGYLQKDYVPILLSGNKFLKTRLDKYRRRGYKITTESTSLNISSSTIHRYILAEKRIKDGLFYKEWYSRALFRFIFYLKYKITPSHKRHYSDVKFNRRITTVFKRDPDVVMTQYELNQPLDAMKNFDPTDGYDSEDFDIENEEGYYPIVNNYAKAIDINKRAEWLAQTNDTKFWKCIRALMECFYSTTYDKSSFGFIDYYNGRYNYMNNDATKERKAEIKRVNLVYDLLDKNTTKDNTKFYIKILNYYSNRNGECVLTLAPDVDVYDLHNHTLEQGISSDGLKEFLTPLINTYDKNTLPCYIQGCTWFLSLDEIRAIVDKDFYLNFTKPVLLPPEPLLGKQGLGDNPGEAETKVDLIDIIKNAPSIDPSRFGNIYHDVLCPFCLSYIHRDEGCTYVTHPSNGRARQKAPYCKEQNIVQAIRDKYINIKPNDPVYDIPYATSYLEVCSECGRPCNHHVHYDLNDPPGFAPPHLTAGGNPDYGRCAGGGRAELFARIIAVRDLVKGAGDMDPKDLRVAAALAADAAASDPELLARGAAILAKEARYRSMSNLNIDVLGNNPLDAIVIEGGRRGRKTRRSKHRKVGTRKN